MSRVFWSHRWAEQMLLPVSKQGLAEVHNKTMQPLSFAFRRGVWRLFNKAALKAAVLKATWKQSTPSKLCTATLSTECCQQNFVLKSTEKIPAGVSSCWRAYSLCMCVSQLEGNDANYISLKPTWQLDLKESAGGAFHSMEINIALL